MKRGLLFLVALSLCWSAFGQKSEGARLAARSNVEAYDDEAGIIKSAYRDSPYFLEMTGRWNQKKTDSSIVYSRELDVEKYWKDYRVSLNVRCGRACRVWLNGKSVGYGDDSRHWNEFALDKFLKYGKKNTLAIETLKHPQEALLESADQLEGLNGEPYLLFKGDPNVEDLSLVADYDALSQSGTLSLDVSVFNSKKKGKKVLIYSLCSPDCYDTARINALSDYAAAKGVDYIDLNRKWREIGIDWSHDTRDEGDHLNEYGVAKVTAYMGAYMKDRYALTDHRGDQAYSSWDDLRTAYDETKRKMEGKSYYMLDGDEIYD